MDDHTNPGSPRTSVKRHLSLSSDIHSAARFPTHIDRVPRNRPAIESMKTIAQLTTRHAPPLSTFHVPAPRRSSKCPCLQMNTAGNNTAENPHTHGDGQRPEDDHAAARIATATPTPRTSHQQQQDGGKTDVLSSTNGPSTVAFSR